MDKPLHILLFEVDNTGVLSVLTQLEEAGIITEVEVASSIEEGLKRLTQDGFDCILLDHKLPLWQAMDVIKQVRSLGMETPVIIINPERREQLMLDLKKIGVSEFVAQGIITHQPLPGMIDAALQKKNILQPDDLNQLFLLNSSGERQRLVIENAPDAIVTFNAKGIITDWNPKAEVVFGWKALEVLGESFSEKILSPSEWNNLQHTINNFINTGFAPWANNTVQVNGQHKDGVVFPVELTMLPAYVNNENLFICFLRDVTLINDQNKAIQEMLHELQEATHELQRSNRELEQFAYIASHDLQEPLRMVTSYVQLLKIRNKERLDKDGQEFIGYIVEGANRMKILINDLLEYSRVGRQRAGIGKVDLKKIVSHVLQNLKEACRESGATIRVKEEALLELGADASQMQRLFQNLISNAIKFRKHDSPVIDIECEEKADAWHFSISDNGIGIPESQLSRIFVIFQRLHNSQEYPGTGIGLAVAKKIVEGHGGNIWVESKVGDGTTFHFTIKKDLDNVRKTIITNLYKGDII